MTTDDRSAEAGCIASMHAAVTEMEYAVIAATIDYSDAARLRISAAKAALYALAAPAAGAGELPPTLADNAMPATLQRYGFPQQALTRPVPCADGYWTPWHTAENTLAAALKGRALIASRHVESKPGAAIKIERLALTPAGVEALTVKGRAAPGVEAVDGWKLVPVEPTSQMLDGGRLKYLSKSDVRSQYAGMLAAAPSPPAAPATAALTDKQIVVDRRRLDALLTALRFYAGGEHFVLEDEDKFDSVSGEPENWLCHEDEGTMFENGTVAAFALRDEHANWLDGDEDITPQPIDGEVPVAAAGKPLPAPSEDARDAAAYALLAEVAALKRHDPNRRKSNAGRWCHFNAPAELVQRIDALLASIGAAA